MIDFSQLFGRSPNPYMVLDRDLRYVAVNDAYLRVTGSEREQLIGVGLFEAFPGDPDDPGQRGVRELRSSLERVFETGQPHTLGLIRYAIAKPGEDGRPVYEDRYWSATHTPLPDVDGVVRHVLQHTVDVTELQRLRAELQAARTGQSVPVEQIEQGVLERAQQVQRINQALEAQRRHLLQLFEEAPGFMAYVSGPRHVFELVNRAYVTLIGGRDVLGQPLREALPEVAGQGYFERLDEVYRTGRPFAGAEAPVLIERDGVRQVRYVNFVYQPVPDAQGRVHGVLVQGHDVTAQRAAQEEVDQYRHHLEELVEARTRALERSEAALAQSRKLEDIGKLTGGVAHDFNNVLQIIGTNLQLLQSCGPLPPAAEAYALAALQGVERGARLASQLLSFARQQPLQPAVLDMGSHLVNLQSLLRGTLGEAIELRVEIEPGLLPVEVDRHQLDNALINLALNARDAMDGRGTLVLGARCERRNVDEDGVPPGTYVLLTVVDHGCGMTPDVRAQAFDPFFTTKDVGQGTGLGLSMVYGFVKQSGGHVAIASEPGAGTEVRLWLPASAAGTPLPEPAPTGMRGDTHGQAEHHGRERVLLVEDDAAVRASVADLMRSLGYRVQAVENAAVAQQLLEGDARFDVLFTDLVMPGRVSGLELARRARILQPGIAVLLTSGYSAAISRDGVDEHMHLLPKPYRREDLARKLHQVVADQAASTCGPMRVLVVDDNADTHSALEALLRVMGYEALGTGSVTEAWSALELGPWDAVLTDLDLGGESGAEFARRIRERWPGMRVIVASGAPLADLQRIEGVQAVLQKPFAPQALKDALET